MSDLEVTITVTLKDELWGFSDCLNGRSLENDEDDAYMDIYELLHEDIQEVLDKAEWKFEEVENFVGAIDENDDLKDIL